MFSDFKYSFSSRFENSLPLSDLSFLHLRPFYIICLNPSTTALAVLFFNGCTKKNLEKMSITTDKNLMPLLYLDSVDISA